MAVEWIDPSPSIQSQKYAFKCHRSAISGDANMETAFPVHCAAFHSTYLTIFQLAGMAHLPPAEEMDT